MPGDLIGDSLQSEWEEMARLSHNQRIQLYRNALYQPMHIATGNFTVATESEPPLNKKLLLLEDL